MCVVYMSAYCSFLINCVIVCLSAHIHQPVCLYLLQLFYKLYTLLARSGFPKHSLTDGYLSSHAQVCMLGCFHIDYLYSYYKSALNFNLTFSLVVGRVLMRSKVITTQDVLHSSKNQQLFIQQMQVQRNLTTLSGYGFQMLKVMQVRKKDIFLHSILYCTFGFQLL